MAQESKETPKSAAAKKPKAADKPVAKTAKSADKGDKAVKEEQLFQDLRERIRDVRQGPDGAIYLLTDNSSGRILRIAPAK